jgi:uncharacterized protein with PIN domain
MNDTPETDNERTLKLALEVFTELANTLKQERDEARERERVAIASWDEERQRALREGECVLEARRERDEAREAVRALAEHAESEIQRISKERDEAREAFKLNKKHLCDFHRDMLGNCIVCQMEGAK